MQNKRGFSLHEWREERLVFEDREEYMQVVLVSRNGKERICFTRIERKGLGEGFNLNERETFFKGRRGDISIDGEDRVWSGQRGFWSPRVAREERFGLQGRKVRTQVGHRILSM